MDTPRDPPKSRVARETKGEGAPKRRRNEGTVPAEERTDARLIERECDGHNPEGL